MTIVTRPSGMANTSPRHMPVLGNVHPIKIEKIDILFVTSFLCSLEFLFLLDRDIQEVGKYLKDFFFFFFFFFFFIIFYYLISDSPFTLQWCFPGLRKHHTYIHTCTFFTITFFFIPPHSHNLYFKLKHTKKTRYEVFFGYLKQLFYIFLTIFNIYTVYTYIHHIYRYMYI